MYTLFIASTVISSSKPKICLASLNERVTPGDAPSLPSISPCCVGR